MYLYLSSSSRGFTSHFINQEINPFSYVEINGLKIADPVGAYNLLWEGVSGHDVEKDGHLHIGPKESLKALTRHFASGNRGPGGHAW
jgi:origin recognition complex subunit 1